MCASIQVEGMWTGLQLCGPAAFLVLCGATNNIVLALCVTQRTLHIALCRLSHCTPRCCRYAVLCIAGIVSSVLGAGYFYFGWALGVPESISAVICIGYAAPCRARTKAPTHPVVAAQLQRGLRGASGPHVLGVRPR